MDQTGSSRTKVAACWHLCFGSWMGSASRWPLSMTCHMVGEMRKPHVFSCRFWDQLPVTPGNTSNIYWQKGKKTHNNMWTEPYSKNPKPLCGYWDPNMSGIKGLTPWLVNHWVFIYSYGSSHLHCPTYLQLLVHLTSAELEDGIPYRARMGTEWVTSASSWLRESL